MLRDIASFVGFHSFTNFIYFRVSSSSAFVIQKHVNALNARTSINYYISEVSYYYSVRGYGVL